MKKSFLISLMLLSISMAGQETFNKRMRFELEAAVLTTVLPTDSTIYAISVFADTIFPYKAGTAFIEFSTDGELLDIGTIKSTEKTFEAWFGELKSLPQGGFAVSGYSRDTTMSSFVIRYDGNGDSLFVSSFQNPYYPTEDFTVPGGGLAVSDIGGFAILNTITSTSSSSQFQLIRMDSLGNKIWDKIYGNNSSDRASSLLKTPDGGFLLGGLRTNQHTNTEDYTFQCHIFKVDSLGNVTWDYLSPVSSGLRDAANDMVLLEDGSLVVASGIGHEIERSSVNVVHFDKMVFKLTPDQEVAWEKVFVEPDRNGFTGTSKLLKLSDGSGFVVAGVTDESDLPPPVLGANTAWITKISNDGDSIWTRHYVYFDDRPSEHIIYDIKELPQGGFIACGESMDLTSGATYRQQAFLMKLDQHGCLVPGCHLVDDVDEATDPQPNLVVYPNPVKDYLNFRLKISSPIEIGQFRIVDMRGEVVQSFQVNVQTGDTYIVPVWDWSAGVYLLQYIDGHGSLLVSEKFIVSQ